MNASELPPPEPSLSDAVAKIQRDIHQQDFQSWAQLLISILIGWAMGQVNLPHLF